MRYPTELAAEPGANIAVARDALAEELRTIEAAIDAAGGSKFEANADFIAKLSREKTAMHASISIVLRNLRATRPADRDSILAVRECIRELSKYDH